MPSNLMPQNLEAEARFKRAGRPRRRSTPLLDIIRVYTRTPGKEPDFTEPVILKRRITVEEVAFSVHKQFAAKLQYARIWGSGKFDGQIAKRDYQVGEGDVINLHL